jgi:hypothetical protein
LKIRKELFDALNQQHEARYVSRLTNFLRERFPDAAQEPVEKLRPEVTAQIAKARGYGLSTEQELADYVISAWLLGQDFDKDFPAAREVLTAPISGNMKAYFLEQWTKQLFEELEGGK